MKNGALSSDKINKIFSHNIILVGIFFIITLALFNAPLLNSESVDFLIAQAKTKPASNSSWLDWFTGFFSPIDFALYSILVLMGWFVNLGAVILGVFTDASVFEQIFSESSSSGKTLRSGWFFVRDFFNIFFILILLFSAFATIFQVEKFHLKRTLLMIVLMALLVNFSWPITMIIIDFGNVIMYFFLENLFTNPSGTGLASSVSESSGIAKQIVPSTFKEANNAENAATELMFRIVFMFLFAITLVVIGAIFLLRLVMLAILAIFAPIGFVAAIFPSTQKYASMWWDNLFKWVFIGPIMIFMLALALNLMGAFNANKNLGGIAGSQAHTGAIQGMLVDAVQLTAAIVILWAGVIVAGKMGGAGGSMLTGYANKAAKWGGRMAVKGSWGLTKAGGRGAARLTRTQGMVGAIKQKWDQSVVAPGQTAKSSNTAKWSARMGVKGAQAKDIQNRASQYDKDNLGNDDLQSRADKGDAAAVLALAKRGQLEEIPATVIAQMNADPGVEGLLSGEIKKKRVDLIIATKHEQAIQKEMTKNGGNRVAAKSSIDLADIERKEFGKLDAEKFASQDWHSIRGDITKPPSDSARRLVQVAKKASPQAQTEMVKRMSAGDFATFNEISSHP